MEEKIREDLKQAQLSRDEVKISTLRLLLSELSNAKIAKGTDLLSDGDIITVIQKEAKKRAESIESFRNGAREDLASKEEAELEILQTYLPEQLSDEELTKVIEEVITNTGATSLADMGKIIGAVMGKVGQKAEGARVSMIVRSKLAN